MNISKKFDKVAFNNAVCKLMLNIPAIENIISDFASKEFTGWEDRECSYCEEGKACKKHRSVERVLQSDRAVQVVGLKMPEHLSGLFISKSDMFVFNPLNNSCLIIDCPPLFTGSVEKLNDSWVRRIIPFTFGEFNKTNELQIEQTVDINEVMTHRSLTCSFNNGGSGYNLLILQNNYGMYHWEIESH